MVPFPVGWRGTWLRSLCFLSRGSRRDPQKQGVREGAGGYGERKEVLSSFPLIPTRDQYLTVLLIECGSVKDKSSAA